MTFEVQILPAAEVAFRRQYRYIARRARRGAAAWARAFFRALKALRHHPERHPLAPENNDHVVEIRQLLFKTRRGATYRALFTIRDQDVFVLDIRGAGQDLLAADELELPD